MTQQILPTFAKGDQVSITGTRGTFIVEGINKDGSVSVYGGPKGRERFRSFPLERVKIERKK